MLANVRAARRVPTTVSRARTSAFRILEFTCFAGPEDRPFEEQHGRACVSIVQSGSFRYRGTTGTAALGPLSLLRANAGDVYQCSHEFGRGDHCLSFSFEPGILESVAADLALRKARFGRPGMPPSARTATLSASAVALLNDRDPGPSLEEIGYELAAAALSYDSSSEEPRSPTLAEERWAMDAMRLIEGRSAEPLTLAGIAALVALSPFHFLRAFRRVAGITPHQYLIAARLRRAASMLLETRRPVTDVAFDCGFGDLSNFIRAFRGAAGRSPRAFRARGRDGVTAVPSRPARPGPARS